MLPSSVSSIVTIVSILAVTANISSASSHIHQLRSVESPVRPFGYEREESLCLVVDDKQGLVVCTPLVDFIHQLFNLVNGDDQAVTLDQSVVGVWNPEKEPQKRSEGDGSEIFPPPRFTLSDFHKSRNIPLNNGDFVSDDNEFPAQALPVTGELADGKISSFEENASDEEDTPTTSKSVSFWQIMEKKLLEKDRIQDDLAWDRTQNGGKSEDIIARKRGRMSKIRNRSNMNPRPTTAGRRIFIGFPMFKNVLYNGRSV
ncbi:uncharacterized protein LOC144451527 [Glandiceps talaboti]